MKTSDERINSINNKVKTKRKQRTVIWTSTVCACLFLALTVVCSLPILGSDVPPINAYKGNEYYPLIQKINERYESDKHSIFQQWGDAINQWGAVGDASGVITPDVDAPSVTYPSTSEGDNNSNKYEETTLNQVDGVIEGDLLKRSTTHAFYLQNGYSKNDEPCLLLKVYKLAAGDTEVVAEYYVRAKDGTSFSQYSSYIDAEMFVNADATRLTIIAPCLSEQRVVYTTVISLDISDVYAIAEVNRVYVSGKYLSSRLVDGKLLVITNFSAGNYGSYGYGQIDYDKMETYIPQCGSTLNSDFIPMKDIYLPNNCLSVNYTVLAIMDETSLEVDDSQAVFSYAQDVYVSREYIVVARNNRYYYANGFDYGNEISVDKAESQTSSKQIMTCEMVALKYGNGIDKLGETGVEGCIKDRYSMDEKDGILRVFTTTRHKAHPFVWENKDSLNVNLYCINLNTMKVVASKERFAPAGDEVKSARFEGDKAYVCTARGAIDPVFYFDLSDLNNITYVDTGEIEGFSVSLIKFNDLLLGIGQGEHNGILKIELYRQSDDSESENGVVSVAKFERDCGFSYEYKAHFVNAEHNLIGLHIYDYGDSLITNRPNINRNKYLLLRYNAETNSLEQVYLEEFDSHGDYDRAFYEHNGVYVFGTNAFAFIDLNS